MKRKQPIQIILRKVDNTLISMNFNSIERAINEFNDKLYSGGYVELRLMKGNRIIKHKVMNGVKPMLVNLIDEKEDEKSGKE